MPHTAPTIYWFRNDLRLEDNPALNAACASSAGLLVVYFNQLPNNQVTRWNVPRTSHHRRDFLVSALADLSAQLVARGSSLLVVEGSAERYLPLLAKEIGADTVYCEEIAAPEEQDEVSALRVAGLTVHCVWQSSLLELSALPFEPSTLPDVFTHFRTEVERNNVAVARPLSSPAKFPQLPDSFSEIAKKWSAVSGSEFLSSADQELSHSDKKLHDSRSSFPYFLPEFSGGSSAGMAHLTNYFDRKLALSYKQTRNGLSGVDYSTKFSPWLASGALSARQIYHQLKLFEAEHGANDSTHWIWFELLWRDYFRFLHLKYGRQLYRGRGLTQQALPSHDTTRFEAWCRAETGEPLVDAGMAELAASGYLSNRLRQIVASYLICDLGCDWRAGAAWFESQLIDYDVYSNQGNWLYIAGRGTDPRNGRRFNIQKQVHDHDRDGTYRRLWNAGG